jgi:hypothetical protein
MPADDREKPATAADVEAILAELEKLPAKEDVRTLRAELERLSARMDVEGLRAELGRLRAEVASLKGLAAPGGAPAAPRPTEVPAEPPVTLDQIGAMVHRSKRSMERYRSRMPPPRLRGRRGQAHQWDWAEVRPWLEQTFGLRLPERFPGHTH